MAGSHGIWVATGTRARLAYVRFRAMNPPMIEMVGPDPPGGGLFHYWRWWGTCRWTGYDFPVITIDTGYLNRPNWLLAGYSVYHMVASQPTIFMTGPRSRHHRRCVRDATDFLWMYDDTQQNRESVRTSTNEPWIRQRSITKLSPLLSPSHRVCIWKFLVRYIVTGCNFCAPSGLRQGQVFNPPPPQQHPPTQLRSECPPPPPGSRRAICAMKGPYDRNGSQTYVWELGSFAPLLSQCNIESQHRNCHARARLVRVRFRCAKGDIRHQGRHWPLADTYLRRHDTRKIQEMRMRT